MLSSTLIWAEPAIDTQTRVLWTTSQVRGTPGPPSPYLPEVAYPHIVFDEPTTITYAPGSDRVFVGDRKGRIYSLTSDTTTSKADLVVDTEREVYGLAFHPDYQKNRYMYAFITDKKPLPPRTQILRYTLSQDEAPTALDESELILMQFPSDGHDGGCLRFGPDGYLYIGTGDGGGSNDVHNTGQYLGDFLSSILRIDVNGTHSVHPYAIPPDNPFVDFPGARPEIWAYGFRQVWMMTFDRLTGELWAGEVGQDLWEMVIRVEPGGNYGWSITEGPQAFRPDRKRGPTPILPPFFAYSHDTGRSITGGYVYRGSQHPDLYGHYIYADYRTGKIWALGVEGEYKLKNRELADTALSIASFAEDHQGELLMLTHEGGRIYRLVPRPPQNNPPRFPTRLSETGLFASVADHVPAPGVLPYSVNSPLWSDHAFKERFLALPGDSQIGFNERGGWRFSDGAVLVKTFSLEMEHGNPQSRRRLETRILTQQDRHWQGYTYVWNDEQTDAVLLGRKALRKTYKIKDKAAPGGEREQTWHYPSRSDCILCHNGSFSLIGLRTVQMNREHDYHPDAEGGEENQISVLDRLGLFSEPLPKSVDKLPVIVNPHDESQPLEARARSYLHANCASCHRYKGGGTSLFFVGQHLALEDTNTVNEKPIHGDFGLEDAKLIAPGAPERSVFLERMRRRGQTGQMPQVGTLEVHEEGVELIRRWIASMK